VHIGNTYLAKETEASSAKMVIHMRVMQFQNFFARSSLWKNTVQELQRSCNNETGTDCAYACA